MTLAELRARWVQRRDEWRRLGVHVDGAKLCEDVLADLEALDAAGEEALTLTAAANECGFSADHLGRLVRAGQLPNAGRANAPRIRRRDLPKKPGTLPAGPDGAILPADRRRIAAAIIGGHNG